MYKEEILEHFKNPRNKGVIEQPSVRVSVKNALCGDAITLTLAIRGDKIEDIKFSGIGCALVTASASLLTEHLKGKSVKILNDINDTFVLKLLGGEITPARIGCALLPLKALKQIKK
ncbi:SUF system NifU family Fe-S cluster assembly protein [candidate division WWE3 bacterium CG10_big_fil_rev_8_21_14_0_10_39_14]|nr:MAG: SUF system NifU family Fe-S cluster assembly protein [candidate division WWE3 bacterium CG10_big_fil_rev_8_21_14_0_10_39_14]